MSLQPQPSAKPTVRYTTAGTYIEKIEDIPFPRYVDSSYEFGHVYFSAQQEPHFEESLSILNEVPDLVKYIPPTSPTAPVTEPTENQEEQNAGSLVIPPSENQGEASETTPLTNQEEAPVAAHSKNSGDTSIITDQDEGSVTDPTEQQTEDILADPLTTQEGLLITAISAPQDDHFEQTAISYSQAPPLINYTPPTSPPNPATQQLEDKQAGMADVHVIQSKILETHDPSEEQILEQKKKTTFADLVGKKPGATIKINENNEALTTRNTANVNMTDTRAALESEQIKTQLATSPEDHQYLMALHDQLSALGGNTNGLGQKHGHEELVGTENYELIDSEEEPYTDSLALNFGDQSDDNVSYGGGSPHLDEDQASYGSIGSFHEDDQMFLNDNFDPQSMLYQSYNDQHVATINPQILELQTNITYEPEFVDNKNQLSKEPIPKSTKNKQGAKSSSKQKGQTVDNTDKGFVFDEHPSSKSKSPKKTTIEKSAMHDYSDSDADSLTLAKLLTPAQRKKAIAARIELPKPTRSRKKTLADDNGHPNTAKKASMSPKKTGSTPKKETRQPKEATPPTKKAASTLENIIPFSPFESGGATDSETQSDEGPGLVKPKIITWMELQKKKREKDEQNTSTESDIELPRELVSRRTRTDEEEIGEEETDESDNDMVSKSAVVVLKQSPYDIESAPPPKKGRMARKNSLKEEKPIKTTARRSKPFKSQKSQGKLPQAKAPRRQKKHVPETDFTLPKILCTELPSLPYICISTVGVIHNSKRPKKEAFRGYTTVAKDYGINRDNTHCKTPFTVLEGPHFMETHFRIKRPPEEDTGLKQSYNVNASLEYALANGSFFKVYDGYDKMDPVNFRHEYPKTLQGKEVLNYPNKPVKISKEKQRTPTPSTDHDMSQTTEMLAAYSSIERETPPRTQNKTDFNTQNMDKIPARKFYKPATTFPYEAALDKTFGGGVKETSGTPEHDGDVESDESDCILLPQKRSITPMSITSSDSESEASDEKPLAKRRRQSIP